MRHDAMKYLLALLITFSSMSFAEDITLVEEGYFSFLFQREKDSWSRADINRQLLYSAFVIADWGQTRDIATRDDHREANKIMGPEPSLSTVNTYFVSILILNYLAVDYMPAKYRPYFQTISIAIHADAVYHNYSIGVNFRF
jgi:hypothetical protein